MREIAKPYPRIVSNMLMKKSALQPRSRKTPTGGMKMAKMSLMMSLPVKAILSCVRWLCYGVPLLVATWLEVEVLVEDERCLSLQNKCERSKNSRRIAEVNKREPSLSTFLRHQQILAATCARGCIIKQARARSLLQIVQ